MIAESGMDSYSLWAAVDRAEWYVVAVNSGGALRPERPLAAPLWHYTAAELLTLQLYVTVRDALRADGAWAEPHYGDLQEEGGGDAERLARMVHAVVAAPLPRGERRVAAEVLCGLMARGLDARATVAAWVRRGFPLPRQWRLLADPPLDVSTAEAERVAERLRWNVADLAADDAAVAAYSEEARRDD